MASLFSKALVYLGLVDEDQADAELDYEPEPAPGGDSSRVARPLPSEGRRVEPPAATSRVSAPLGASRADTASATVRSIRPESRADILMVEEFGDARLLADRVRDRVPVVLDFRRAGGELMRRVIDFSSGLVYALSGTMTKVGEGLVLVLPHDVALSRDEKYRLAALGAYELEPDA
jgi:cell division inhibitor SepF